jgi:hypothetical protein
MMFTGSHVYMIDQPLIDSLVLKKWKMSRLLRSKKLSFWKMIFNLSFDILDVCLMTQPRAPYRMVQLSLGKKTNKMYRQRKSEKSFIFHCYTTSYWPCDEISRKLLKNRNVSLAWNICVLNTLENIFFKQNLLPLLHT